MKRFGLKSLLCLSLVMSTFSITLVHAETDYSDSSYWMNRCQVGNIVTQDDYYACKGYTEYIASQTPGMEDELAAINSKKAEIAANIAENQKLLEQYQAEVETLTSKLNELEAQISSLEASIVETQNQIVEKQAEIDASQQVIDEMSEKVKRRIVNAQSTLRINSMIDIILGAKSLSELLRITSALSAITENERQQNEELVQAMDQLRVAQAALSVSQDQLELQQKDLEDQQKQAENSRAEVLVKQYQVQVIQDAAHQQEAELEAQGNQVAANISSVQGTMNSISSDLDSLQEQIFKPKPTPTPTPEATPDSGNGEGGGSTDSGNTDDSNTETPSNPTVATGWARPVSGSYRSAGTWNYPGGGVHLGYDFAVSIGTNLYAAGTGVILNSVNGCGVGYLGNSCGYQYGGSTGGGNQVYLLCVVNDSLYAVKYLHMQLNTPIATGTIVQAGDYIGKVGSSGNSSGAHCHIEVTYLGDGENFANYAKTWNGDLTFGAGWAGSYDGYGRRCEAGYGAPCRIRPEEIWGY